MFEQIEECKRCITLKGKGFFSRVTAKRQMKKEGRVIFEENKLPGGYWTMVVSTKKYFR